MKCVFRQPFVKFRGCLTPERIQPFPDKVSTILKNPKPETLLELRVFVAMLILYRRFLPNAATTQAFLNYLLRNCMKKDKCPVPWIDEAVSSFDQ